MDETPELNSQLLDSLRSVVHNNTDDFLYLQGFAPSWKMARILVEKIDQLEAEVTALRFETGNFK